MVVVLIVSLPNGLVWLCNTVYTVRFDLILGLGSTLLFEVEGR